MPLSTNLSLANYLFNQKSGQSESYASILQKNTSFLTRDSNGKLALPTEADFKKAKTPAEQLRVASNLAKAAKVQTDAAAQTGITTRLSDITTQTKQAMDSLKTTVNTIQALTGEDGLKASKSAISSALSTLRSSMQQINQLSRKTNATTRATLQSTLKDMDSAALSLATTAGLKWSSPLSSSTTTNQTNKSSTTSSPSSFLVDFLT